MSLAPRGRERWRATVAFFAPCTNILTYLLTYLVVTALESNKIDRENTVITADTYVGSYKKFRHRHQADSAFRSSVDERAFTFLCHLQTTNRLGLHQEWEFPFPTFA